MQLEQCVIHNKKILRATAVWSDISVRHLLKESRHMKDSNQQKYLSVIHIQVDNVNSFYTWSEGLSKPSQ
jgi:hypothetical protein